MIAQAPTLTRLLLSYLIRIRHLRIKLEDMLSLEGFGVV